MVPETLTITPAKLDFGRVKSGHTTNAQIVTIANKKGKKGKNSLPVLIFAPTPPDMGFTISSDNCQSTLAVGNKCELGVTFTPASKGKKTSQIQINDNANRDPQTVDLNGTGTK